MKYAHLADLHRQTARRYGPRIALRYRQQGLYRDLDWREYRRQADGVAAWLIQAGIQPGDRVALLSENRHEWFVADHGILSAGAVNVPLHAPLSPEQVAYQVGHSGSRGIFVSGRAQAEKVFAVLEQLPDLEFLVCFDPFPCDRAFPVWTWTAVMHRGWQAAELVRQQIPLREAQLHDDSLATIIYTSGTTGKPKGVMLTHGNLLSNAISTGEISCSGERDVLLSWLPYSHIYARTVDHYMTTALGMTVALADSIDTLMVNLREIQPTWLTAVPRFYEKVWNAVATLEPGTRREKLHAIFGPNIRQLSSGGAPLPDHIAAGFQEAGIPLLQGYGLTESSPVISFNSLIAARLGTVGQAIPGVEVRIDADGEILTRGPHVMRGYWKNEEATRETITPDGWLRTGDVGELDADGFLKITDRKKDLIVTSSGKNIAPSEIERLLCSDPYIEQAVVYGDGRHFLTALIVPATGRLAVEFPIPTTDGDFLEEEQIALFYAERIKHLMQAVSTPEQVKKFLLLARPFSLGAEELTATLKVRRRHIIQKYETALKQLYEDQP